MESCGLPRRPFRRLRRRGVRADGHRPGQVPATAPGFNTRPGPPVPGDRRRPVCHGTRGTYPPLRGSRPRRAGWCRVSTSDLGDEVVLIARARRRLRAGGTPLGLVTASAPATPAVGPTAPTTTNSSRSASSRSPRLLHRSSAYAQSATHTTSLLCCLDCRTIRQV